MPLARALCTGALAIACGSGPAPVAGPPQRLLPFGAYGLHALPDGKLTYIASRSGGARFWVSSGTAAGPGRSVPLQTTGFATFVPVLARNGVALAAFGPSDPGSNAFDADYAGVETILPAADNALTMYYHAENHRFGSTVYPFEPFYASVGLARSTDGGLHWRRLGQILTGMVPKPAGKPPRDALGAGEPSAIVVGSFIYLFYVDWNLTYPDSIHVARAPLAGGGLPGTWKKFDGSGFRTSGLGGASVPVLGVPPPQRVNVYSAAPDVSYNTYFSAYLMTYEGGDGFYYATSRDLVHWTYRGRYFKAPNNFNSIRRGQAFALYATAVTPGEPNERTTGQTGYLYYGSGIWSVVDHTLERRSFTF